MAEEILIDHFREITHQTDKGNFSVPYIRVCPLDNGTYQVKYRKFDTSLNLCLSLDEFRRIMPFIAQVAREGR